MKNDFNKPRPKDNGKNATIRGTRIRGKEEQCDKKRDEKCQKTCKISGRLQEVNLL